MPSKASTSLPVLRLIRRRRLAVHQRPRGRDRLDDVVVAGAAAEIAFQALADLASRSRPSGCVFTRSIALITMPGVQKPHCSAWCSRNISCIGCSVPSAAASPSIVSTERPSACSASMVQDFDRHRRRHARRRRRTGWCRSRHGCRSARASRAAARPAACGSRPRPYAACRSPSGSPEASRNPSLVAVCAECGQPAARADGQAGRAGTISARAKSVPLEQQRCPVTAR